MTNSKDSSTDIHPEDESRTTKGQFRQGVSGNPNGRPKGSRNRDKIILAQNKVDDLATATVEFLADLMLDNMEEDVPMNLRLKAAEILFKKQVADQKNHMETEAEEKKATSQEAEVSRPTFQRTATVQKIG